MTKDTKSRCVQTMSLPPIADRLEQLKALIPEAFTEGRVDFAKLQAALGEFVDDSPERYSFSWAGKRDAIRLLQMPTRATLVPCPEESLDWDSTRNLFIEGDNLEVLKLLLKPYYGRVKMIYIDPPYNRGKGDELIYRDNYADPLEAYLHLTGQKDAEGNLMTSNPETSGRYHSTWLSMMYPRLFYARQLLTNDGFIVISIDDAELGNLRSICNDIFGEENFIAVLVYDRNRKNDSRYFSVGHEYMVVYARDKGFLDENKVILRVSKEGVDDVKREFQRLRELNKDDWKKVRDGLNLFFANMDDDDPRRPLARFSKVDEQGPYRDDGNINWPGGDGPRYEVLHPTTGKPCKIPKSGWRYPTRERMQEKIDEGVIVFGADETTIPGIRTNLFDLDTQVMRSVQYSYAQTATNEFDAIFDGIRVFDNPKHFNDLLAIVQTLTDKDDLVVDFFAGSATLAHAVLLCNRKYISQRRYICVQLPEPVNQKEFAGKNALRLGLLTVAEIGKERIRRVVARMKKERAGQLALDKPEDLGFKVYKLAESNWQAWSGLEDVDGESYVRQMEMFDDPLVEGWQAEAVLAEVALKEAGFGLNYKVEPVKAVTKQKVHRVTDPEKEQFFYICLDAHLQLKNLKPIELKPDDLFVCRASALDDEAAANLELQCRLMVI